MKDRTLVYISLALGILSLGYAFWVHQHSEEAATKALRKREAELVQHWRPKFEEIYRGMGIDAKGWPKNPTTLEELFDPSVKMMNGLIGSSESDTNVSKEQKP